ncbi:MAG: bifunctional (p)ppGpp synthetase/guanosine-3',5'-bis(diphosphate) 3'-pyrophosphohydrolase [Candidatus Alcyoniella australis]|nr:bifunctional (p)ppGpp synthetase/guanosine-3',5'-bis(diphosphate) 3'-pyrophosphohydrolase [Candidatus Alcyoniella australis]
MIRLNEIIDRVAKYNPEADLDLIRRAYIFSARAHAGQLRQSGEPYLIHPLEVANQLANMRLDVASVATGLLHDTLEDCEQVNIERLTEVFGKEIAGLVDGVTKIGRMSFGSSAEAQAENFKKIILATAKDIRVILIKLADRLHNMRTIEHLNKEKQQRVARETMEIYAPLAQRLGMQAVKTELEDLSFRVLNSDEYYKITLKLKKGRREREKYVQEVIRLLKEILDEHGIKADVMGRIKNVHSIASKMTSQGLSFEQVYDLIAFRIVVEGLQDCYEVLGVIHSIWKPVPGRFKDYIALPKDNMYKSLHTTVIGPYGERVEIQIRTNEMHALAEEGIAAHWRYKQGVDFNPQDDHKFAWLRRLLEWQRDLEDPEEFLNSVKLDLFPDEVYVFTPHGDVKSFPKGATPIDFAYSIHTEVGNSVSGARVNGSLVPLKYQLKSGERVEIITSKSARPSRDWMKIVKTPQARNKINSFLKREERARAMSLGRSLLEKALRRYKISLNKVERDERIEEIAKKFGAGNFEGLLTLIGFGKVTTKPVVSEFAPQAASDKPEPKQEGGAISKILSPLRGRNRGIRVSGVDDVVFRIARCCNPLPGEPIVGFITRGRGVTIHSTDCPEVEAEEEERKVEVEWDLAANDLSQATIRITSEDIPGMLAAISKVISTESVNITRVHIETTHDKQADHTFSLQVRDVKQLDHMIRALRKIKGVIRVERMRNPVGG